MGTDDLTRPNVIERHKEHIQQLKMESKIPIGDVYLKPYWRKDYCKMLEDYKNK